MCNWVTRLYSKKKIIIMYWVIKNLKKKSFGKVKEIINQKKIFFFFNFMAAPVACGSSQVTE